VLAGLLLREEIGIWQQAGGACVVAGVLLTTQAGPIQPTPLEPEVRRFKTRSAREAASEERG
jgi:hypothetical protein